ncbi:thioredoxin-dependent thiol peroxidase [Myxococcus qinghaiensis]|uniref:thioredoxin-dependent thiol peroxidase n=1 Tax=Myxococcus qinghaiensis TaxID=2906758 RepID=UPI0020A78A9A|nr:thioredoxin-dependent thiol peroxidase [Myxococcus qinghaiensis]MCP3165476.1 thioredoxin-dependent thiol peroxidase [Myxococcus qinghaiensis]
MPQAGDAAPDFVLQDQDGNSVTLSQLAGKNVVLYFYPKDDTPGCTVEACAFRDEHSVLEAAGAVVLGVSADSTASHRKFATKFNLPFPLLADTEHQVSDAYGVWGEKSLYGRKFLGINRATFLIGTDGKVKQVWPKVKVNGHVVEVLAALGAKPSAPVAGGSALEVEEAAAPELSAAYVRGSERAADDLTPLSGTPLTAPARVTKFEPSKRKSAATKAPASKPASQDEAVATEDVEVKAAPVKKAAPATKAAVQKAAPVEQAAPATKASAQKAASAEKAAPARKTSVKKAAPATKGASAKKAVSAKKGPLAKKAAPAKKASAKKAAPVKKAAAKKSAPVKKSAAKKTSAKKAAPVKKASAKKGALAKKSAPAKKKSAAKRK